MSRQAVPVQRGETIDYKNSGAAVISVGDIVPLVNLCGVAEVDIAAGEEGVVAIYGVWEVAAETGVAFSVGDKLYWNTADKKATKTSTGNVYLGFAVAPKASAGTTARFKIGGNA